MRWCHGHAKHAKTSAAAGPAAVDIQGLRQARAGTAAEHPALVVTPDRRVHRGAFVADTFYEDRGTSFVQAPWRSHEQREREIEERAVLVENEATKDAWWLDRPQRHPKENGGWTVRGNR